MPYQLDFDPTHRILRCRWEGSVTDTSLKECYTTAGRAALLTHPSAAILDFTGATSFEASSQTVRDLAGFAPALPSTASPAFIVAPSSVLYGMARMFQAMGHETRPLLQVVHNVDQVYAALGIPEPRFEPLEQLEPYADTLQISIVNSIKIK